LNRGNSLGNEQADFVAEQFLSYCENKKRKERQRRLAYIEHKKDMQESRRIVAGLSLLLSVMIVLCVAIVSLNMQNMQKKEQVALLEERVLAAKEETKEARKRLAGMTDYKWVEKEARKLGMSRVTPDKIYYYTVEADDFMVQYQDVPKPD
jgi:Septum formation initiator.